MHSYYDVPAFERFSAEPQGGFELVGISSPSEAVLDYYELEGRKSAEGTWMSLTIYEPRRFEALPLVGTETGQKTLVVSGERLPLYADRAKTLMLQGLCEATSPSGWRRIAFPQSCGRHCPRC